MLARDALNRSIFGKQIADILGSRAKGALTDTAAGVQDIVKALNDDKGTVYRQLVSLEEKGKVRQMTNKLWEVVTIQPTQPGTTMAVLVVPVARLHGCTIIERGSDVRREGFNRTFDIFSLVDRDTDLRKSGA